MPDIMRDWHIWWLDFWSAHPFLFWTMAAIAVALHVVSRRIRRRR